MNRIRVCIIGAGNISNTRHIPAILKNANIDIVGVISNDAKKIERTNKKYNIENNLVIDNDKDIVEQLNMCSWFMNNVDAVIIGTPPREHFKMVKACLTLKKHTLVEKPMMMSLKECDEVIQISQKNKLTLYVMHSFQYSNGILEMEKRLKSGEFGKIESILELQLTNRRRRLPIWYNDLPLGLYYDEAAHFFYTAMNLGGELEVKNASAQFNDKQENTPKFMQAQLKAGDIPLQMFMNFNSPICEWGVLVLCDKKVAIYDFFKDILIVIDNDDLHLAKNVLKVSLQFTYGFWKGFIKNGFKMINKSLLYGHDRCIESFVKSINTGEIDNKLSATTGRKVVKAMNEVVDKINMEESKC
ncbi:Gfo/Idh/MocA family protein [Clostridium butyricum]|uniref:Gfo/Idh/MocA family protein n=1 Tax=Clostridium butyricum TaxID=1492 RepID=UPI0018AC3B6C|nr:Gfo/Idh/MocA family oxidoreductase [Clostridium butyricum]